MGAVLEGAGAGETRAQVRGRGGASAQTRRKKTRGGASLGKEVPQSSSTPEEGQEGVRGSGTQNLPIAQEWLDRAGGQWL